MYQLNSPRSAWETLPTMYDLKSEDPEEPGLPDEFHAIQPQLLKETLRPKTYGLEDVFVGTDLNVYYDVKHPQWYKRPDWFVALGVTRSQSQEDLRLSYVMWQEGVVPFLVVELLSPGTEDEDLGQTLQDVEKPPTKWNVYERVLRVPYYVVFSRYTGVMRVFEMRGMRYQELEVENDRFWISEIGLGLGVWEGRYESVEGRWLRWYGEDGAWLSTLQQQVDQMTSQLGEEQLRSERLIEQLRALGIEPE
jgi:Uma2 family endonuclease